MVGFTSFIAGNLPECFECPVCLVEITGAKSEKKAVIHKGGERHPIHEKCLQAWLTKKANCPSCRKDIHQVSTSIPAQQLARSEFSRQLRVRAIRPLVNQRVEMDSPRRIDHSQRQSSAETIRKKRWIRALTVSLIALTAIAAIANYALHSEPVIQIMQANIQSIGRAIGRAAFGTIANNEMLVEEGVKIGNFLINTAAKLSALFIKQVETLSFSMVNWNLAALGMGIFAGLAEHNFKRLFNSNHSPNNTLEALFRSQRSSRMRHFSNF